MNKAYLGIDYGRKRIGLATSELGLIAKPLKTIENRGERRNLTALAQIAVQYNIGTIVLGLPVHNNTAMSDEVRTFAKTLEPLGCVIAFQNEMLTSVAAERICHHTPVAAGRPCHPERSPQGRSRMGLGSAAKSIDSIAASVILQEYLDKKGESNGL